MDIENKLSNEESGNLTPDQKNIADKEQDVNTLPSGGPETDTARPDSGEKVNHSEHEDHKGKKKHRKISEKELESLQYEAAELKDKYLRLYSEFENFRRRSSKEKLELIKTAGEEVLVVLLPVIDDFERAIKSSADNNGNNSGLSDGIQLIYNKLKYITEQKGLKVMNTEKGTPFNAEMHEAITQLPVDDEKLKGKIIDILEKGYYLNDKVIRFAKVVTGS
jgi:molecular chaperone GrpE